MLDGFVQLLHSEYQRRYVKNPRYSKRAFAKDLGLSKSCLHDILSGNRPITQKTADKVSKSLSLTDIEIQEILALGEKHRRHPLEQKDFSEIHHWYYFAILNLAETKGARFCSTWISERLDITIETAQEALDKLYKMKLVDREGDNLTRTSQYIDASWNTPSRSIKLFHSENLSRAEKALYEIPMELREVLSVTSSLSYKQFIKIKKETQKFKSRLIQITQQKDTDAEQVFTMAVQVFPQTKGTFNELT